MLHVFVVVLVVIVIFVVEELTKYIFCLH